jgi:Fe-S cluster biosynthesis and repair protein YggX
LKKVALYSDRNIYWGGLGELKVGYNIVSKEASEQWITRKAVRIAQPEEVASYYGK